MTANTGTVRNPAERRRRLFAVFLIGMVEVMFVLLVAAVVADVSGISGSAPAFAYDSRAYDDAAIRLLQTGSPYQAQTLGGPFLAGPQGLYLYSPLPAIMAIPFTVFRLHDAATVYVGLQLVGLMAICMLMPVRWRPAMASPPVRCCSACAVTAT